MASGNRITKLPNARITLLGVELHDELLQLEELQLEELQLDESHFDAIVEPERHVESGAQTSAGTPWLARPGVPE